MIEKNIVSCKKTRVGSILSFQFFWKIHTVFSIGPIRFTLYLAYSASFFSQNSIFQLVSVKFQTSKQDLYTPHNFACTTEVPLRSIPTEYSEQLVYYCLVQCSTVRWYEEIDSWAQGQDILKPVDVNTETYK